MFAINTILQEINELPAHQLEEVYEFVHSLKKEDVSKTKKSRNKILSFAGSFSDMPQKDYTDFKRQTRKMRR